MTKNYLNYQEVKKSFAIKGTLVLIVMAIIFMVILIRFARSGSGDDTSGTPDSDVAYSIAKQFIKPTLKFDHISFPESGYQCAQKPDSVFIIKSYAESKNVTGGKNITTFEITLRFNGGIVSDKKSWKVMDLTEN